MPTARPRIVVTETDELAAALDAAASQHPGVTRPQLLVLLALHGERSAQLERDRRLERRRAAVRRHSGALTGTYGAGYLEQLRADWPE